jgi:hypothetical protein
MEATMIKYRLAWGFHGEQLEAVKVRESPRRYYVEYELDLRRYEWHWAGGSIGGMSSKKN